MCVCVRVCACVCRYVGGWACGCVGVWACGCVGVWIVWGGGGVFWCGWVGVFQRCTQKRRIQIFNLTLYTRGTDEGKVKFIYNSSSFRTPGMSATLSTT
jgi:hypothetical protein